MTLVYLWLGTLACLPGLVVVSGASGLATERLRLVAVLCAASMLVVSAGALFVTGLQSFAIPWPGATSALLGPSALRVDRFSSALIPLPAALWLLTVAVTPCSRLDRAGLPRTAVATLAATVAFLSVSPLLLLLCWLLSAALFLSALSTPENQHARRVAVSYLGLSSLLFTCGILLLSWPAAERSAGKEVGLWLILVAALVRKGIFPFHAWIPETFDRGQLGPSILFSAPQLGSYVVAVLFLPQASAGMLRFAAVLALVTTVYAAALALIQRDARRACGYLFVSQSALVLAGLDCTSREALAGALVLWISSALAFAGIARCVLVLEARRGRLDLTRYHGGYEQMPLLAVSFLLLGLACTGFPGTLGFVGTELLVSGATMDFPVLGFCLIVAGALTGLAVMRMYLSLFCGRRDGPPRLPLLRREAIAFGSLAAVLVIFALVPGPIVASRLRASDQLLSAYRRDGLAESTATSQRRSGA